ncbi:hypothetical protein [Patulibacter sp. SYSU D01012]|uniref:hypothetical protein n=1 Tax=Patulibacter sp. SYSU D01012 TaxID=2817381 RepID=UPI001B314851|nr:hypothetical protein [Patulibacter sp. SYSU D01012]
MPKSSRVLAAVAAAGVLSLAAAGAAGAAEPAEPTLCDGVLTGVVAGDVIVPYDATCTLRGALVRGAVTSEPDAAGLVVDRSVVAGDVAADAVHRVEIRRSALRGALGVVEARDGATVTSSVVAGPATLAGTGGGLVVGGDTAALGNAFGDGLTVSGGSAGGTIARNVVRGDLRVSGVAGALVVRRNLVTGELGCADNTPAPTGGGNVAGAATGQCAAL